MGEQQKRKNKQQIVHRIYVQFTECQLCLSEVGFVKHQRKDLE